MSKIYTKTGDKGETGLFMGARVKKDDPRVAAYGDVDELNSVIGAALSAMAEFASLAPLRASLSVIQEELFVIGALLATPKEHIPKLGPPFDKSFGPQNAKHLEDEIDKMDEDLVPMTKFILPGGSPQGAGLHFARTVCRRAERSVVTLMAKVEIPDGVSVYLNRLSDHLFTAARWATSKRGVPETQWQGRTRPGS